MTRQEIFPEEQLEEQWGLVSWMGTDNSLSQFELARDVACGARSFERHPLPLLSAQAHWAVAAQRDE